jgi:ABC-type transporter Mla subunit MlaD
MTSSELSAELRRHAHYQENATWGGACKSITDALYEAADEIDRLSEKIQPLGTIIVNQSRDIERLTAALKSLVGENMPTAADFENARAVLANAEAR